MEHLDYLIEPLTEQENAVLQLLVEGCSNQDIAERLVLAPSTVKWYVRQLNSKLDTRNRKQIVERATSLGLIDQQDAPQAVLHNLPAPTTPFIGRKQTLHDLRLLLADETVRLITIQGPGGIGKTRLALEVARFQLDADHYRDGVYFVDLAPISTSADVYNRAIIDIITMLDHGYPLSTCIKQAAASIPEPGAGCLRRLLYDIEAGETLAEAIARVQQQAALIGFDELFEILRTQQDHPDDLVTRLHTLQRVHPATARLGDRGDVQQQTAQLITTTIINTLTQALGQRGFGHMPFIDQTLSAFFVDRQMLLVLDNFEHVLQGAFVLAELLSRAPGLRIVVTSREKLNLAGETVYLLDGLGVSRWETIAAALEAESGRLFIQTAKRTNPHFAVTQDGLEALIRIGTLTDGMPLGLLLAASWADVLTLHEIADEIQHSADFLQTEQQDIADRHRSMRALFNSAWQRLAPEPQTVFAKLSIFQGGCTREAARVVTGADLPTIKRLVNSSLVFVLADGRYRIHELLRQYAAEHLARAANTRDETHARHATYFLELARTADEGLTTSDQQIWFQRLSVEYDNLRAALTWCATQNDVQMMASMCIALYRFWALSVSWQEGLSWIAQVLRTDNLPDHLLVKMRFVRSTLLFRQGDLAAAREDALFALSYAQTTGDTAGQANAQLALANIENEVGDNELAASYGEQCLTLFRDLNADYYIVTALNVLACIRVDLGQPDAAGELFRESADRAQTQGLTVERAEALVNSGLVAALRGDVVGVAACREGLRLIADLREHHAIAFILTGLAAEAGLYGDHVRAGILAGAAAALRENRHEVVHPMNQYYITQLTQHARGPLDDAAWTAAMQQGKHLALEQVITLALNL